MWGVNYHASFFSDGTKESWTPMMKSIFGLLLFLSPASAFAGCSSYDSYDENCSGSDYAIEHEREQRLERVERDMRRMQQEQMLNQQYDRYNRY